MKKSKPTKHEGITHHDIDKERLAQWKANILPVKLPKGFKPTKRCKDYIKNIGCVGGQGYPIDENCKGYAKRSCNEQLTPVNHPKQVNKSKPTKLLSDCCKSSIRVDGDKDEGTMYYVCAKCNRPCDVHYGKQVLSKVNKPLAKKEPPIDCDCKPYKGKAKLGSDGYYCAVCGGYLPTHPKHKNNYKPLAKEKKN